MTQPPHSKRDETSLGNSSGDFLIPIARVTDPDFSQNQRESQFI